MRQLGKMIPIMAGCLLGIWVTLCPLAGSAGAADVRTSPISVEHPDALGMNVNEWIHVLAEQKGFEAWKGAVWTKTPLGAGLHGWVVQLENNGKPVGYMIVAAKPTGDGYALVEYGTGEVPLFSMKTLHQALVRQGLIPSMTYEAFVRDYSSKVRALYYDPLHAYWFLDDMGKQAYLDPKTGDELPVTKELLASVVPMALTDTLQAVPALAMRASARLPEFDPMDDISWLGTNELSAEEAVSSHTLNKPDRHIVYEAQLFEGLIGWPFALTGLHEWSEGALYAAIDDLGARFTPLTSLTPHGHFYATVTPH